jgi:hypothetical protein
LDISFQAKYQCCQEIENIENKSIVQEEEPSIRKTGKRECETTSKKSFGHLYL